MKTPPLQQVKDRFGDKTKLVAAVQDLAKEPLWLDRVNAEKGLAKASNAKLLRLHDALTRAKEQFGTRDKLIAALLGLANRSKDAGYQQSLERYPVPRLLDLHDVLSKRASKNKPSAPAPAKKRRPRSKKAKLKAAA